MGDNYEAAKLAAVREAKKSEGSDIPAYGVGFIHGFRAGWDAARSKRGWVDSTPVGATAETEAAGR